MPNINESLREAIHDTNDLSVQDTEMLEAYRNVFMQAAEPIMILEDGKIVDCNNELEKLFDLPRNEILGFSPAVFSPKYQMDGELSSEKANLYLRNVGNVSSQVFEWIHNRRDGTIVIVQVSLNTFMIKDKHYVSAFLRDISDLKRKNTELERYQIDLKNLVKEKTENLETLNEELSFTVKELQASNQELNKANEELNRIIRDYGREKKVSKELQNLLLSSQLKLKSFISQSADGIVIVNAESQVIEWNQKMVEITGIEYENVIYKKIYDVKYELFPKSLNSIEKYNGIKDAINSFISSNPNKEIRVMEKEFELMSGETIFINITVYPIKIQNITLFGCIVKDITQKKKQEKELEYYQKNLEELVDNKTKEVNELSNQFNELFNNSSDCIFFILRSSSNRFLYTRINQQGRKALYMNKENYTLPIDLEKIVQNEFQESFKANLNKCLNTGVPINYDETIPNSDGETIWNTTLIPYKRANGKYTRLVGFSRNITSVRKAQEAMEFVDELYKSSQSLIIVFNELGRVVNFNNECERLSGYNFNDYKDIEFWDYPVTLEEDKLAFKKLFEKAVNGVEQKFDLYANWRTRENKLIWIYWKNSCHYSSDGSFKYLIATGVNITEKKIFESALVASERKFKNIFDCSEDGIAIISQQMTLVQANPALQKMLAANDEQLYEGTVFGSISQNHIDIVKQVVEELLLQKTFSNFEIELIGYDGRKFPVEISARLIEYEGESAFLTIIRDITERKEIEKVILHTIIDTEERERRRLAGDLHDEIGPLLASLRMYVSTLQQKLKETDYSEVLGIMMKLIKNSVENIRTISNNISPHLIERYGLASAINAEVDNVRLLLPISFQTNTSGLKFSRNIELIFYRIVKELINNTIKYANANCATINLSYSESMLSLDYTDDGIGFDIEEIEKEKNKGLGLFNIVNRIKSIKGDYAYNTSPGKGFNFTLSAKSDLR